MDQSSNWCCSLALFSQKILFFGMCFMATYKKQTGFWLALQDDIVCILFMEKHVTILTGKLSAL